MIGEMNFCHFFFSLSLSVCASAFGSQCSHGNTRQNEENQKGKPWGTVKSQRDGKESASGNLLHTVIYEHLATGAQTDHYAQWYTCRADVNYTTRYEGFEN